MNMSANALAAIVAAITLGAIALTSTLVSARVASAPQKAMSLQMAGARLEKPLPLLLTPQIMIRAVATSTTPASAGL